MFLFLFVYGRIKKYNKRWKPLKEQIEGRNTTKRARKCRQKTTKEQRNWQQDRGEGDRRGTEGGQEREMDRQSERVCEKADCVSEFEGEEKEDKKKGRAGMAGEGGGWLSTVSSSAYTTQRGVAMVGRSKRLESVCQIQIASSPAPLPGQEGAMTTPATMSRHTHKHKRKTKRRANA